MYETETLARVIAQEFQEEPYSHTIENRYRLSHHVVCGYTRILTIENRHRLSHHVMCGYTRILAYKKSRIGHQFRQDLTAVIDVYSDKIVYTNDFCVPHTVSLADPNSIPQILAACK